MRAVGGEADQLAAVEARRIEHDVVEMLAADLALVHDDDVARREAVEAVARDAVGDRDAEVGEEDRQAAAVLRDHPRLGVDQPAAIVADLVDHHVVGGLGQRVRHLVGIGDDGVAHDLDGDRMGFVAGHTLHVDDEVAGVGHGRDVARMNERGGVRLLDHGGPFDLRAGGQRRPPDDARANGLGRIGEDDVAPLVGDRRLRRPWLRQPALGQRVRSRGGDDETDVDDLQPLVGRGLAVALVVLGVERLAQRREIAASAVSDRAPGWRWCAPGRHSAGRRDRRSRRCSDAMPSRATWAWPASASSANTASTCLASSEPSSP